MRSSPTSPDLSIDPQRKARVEAARDGWIRALIDTSRRNNLLYHRDLKIGTLDLGGAEAAAMARLLKQEEVALSKLLPKTADLKVSEAKLLEIRSRALTNSEERGIETLFMAMGMATWDSPDGERPAQAPILLLPLKVEARGHGRQGLALRRVGDIQANLVLLHMLETEFGVEVSPEDLLSVLQGDDEGDVFDMLSVSDKLKLAACDVPGFSTTERVVVGNFAFQKTAMVRDLRESADVMAQHDLIAAIAGDPSAQRVVREQRVPCESDEIDRTLPEDEFLFLDADSSQQLVIRKALKLQDGTIQGPPGTGKSQTIANLIAEFSARGRRVLFVAEKRAALEVVLERLHNEGLDHLALDLHGAEISRRDVMDRLQASLDQIGRILPVVADQTHNRLIERRDRLVNHVRRLHSVCIPTGRTVYDVQGRLLRLGAELLTATRWRDEHLDSLSMQYIEKASDLLTELREHRALFLRCSKSPWNGAGLVDGGSVRQATMLAQELAKEWTAWKAALNGLCEQAGLVIPASIVRVRETLQLIQELRVTFNTYQPELFTELQLDDLLSDLAPATLPRIQRTWQYLVNGDYRKALSMAKRRRHSRKVSAPQVREEVARALDQDKRWRPLAQGREPRPVPSFLDVRRAWEPVELKLREMAAFLRRDNLDSLDLELLATLLERLAADRTTPPVLPRLCEIETELEQLGVQPFVEELREKQPDADQFVPMLEHAWLSSALDRVFEGSPDLASFRGRAHDHLVDEFKKLDKKRIQIAASRVRRTHAENAIAAMNAYPEEADLVRRECRKKFRGLSIRKLLAQAPHVLTALRPCWMASPLSVSHLLPVDRRLFDVVLFDEASQVLPEDAVSALLRSERAVVAGDRHQLPPTTFFLAEEELDDVDDEEAPTKGFESILDLMSGLFEPWTLDWHYRSLDESLISFSNRHIYSNRLVTFPGPGKHRAIEHHVVNPLPTDVQEESVSAEVAKVVELVLTHAAERPAETLGVITLGIKHRKRIARALEEVLRDRPELDDYFDESHRERFFVKNLERVQGDERDAIILSVGYGKDRSGKLPYRFGPLLYEGGERRLNVAVTRARRRMTLVSSFDHRDMDPNRSRARGVELLRLYLEFAASGGRNLGDAQGPEVPLNEFEQAVHDALIGKGLRLLPQWGASRYRIDLVAQHPQREGRLVLAIECDGASYHSAQTARDRDRLRQQHLEALGWRFHRIWSTDWFLNREEEITRAMEAYKSAVEAADRHDESGEPMVQRVRSAANTEIESVQAKRGRRPILGRRHSIDEYSEDELVRMVLWLQSDELLRTDDQLLDEMVDELGFERRGARIVTRIQQAIEQSRAS